MMATRGSRFQGRCFLFGLLLCCRNLFLVCNIGVVNGDSSSFESQSRRKDIVNGRLVVDPSDAQFFVRSGKDDRNGTPDYLCGGVLIHTDIILTAAHCQGAFNYGVFLYDEDTNDYTREATIDLQIRYPDFNGIDTHNDMLLLRLESNPKLPSVKLNSDESKPRNDDLLQAYGFGKMTSNGAPSKRLRQGQMRYIDNQECTKRVEGTANSVIWDDVLCADPYSNISPRFEDGSSICQGDSGGPLLNTSNELVGVISWNFFCKSDELPDGFARVSYFYEWIQEQICYISRNPYARNNECPLGTSMPPPAAGSITVLLDFTHDFFPEETFFRVLSKTNGEVEYAGPKYVPDRESAWISKIDLLPGEYTLEIFDMAGNGMSPHAGEDRTKGSWILTAMYDDGMERLLKTGGADFEQTDLVDFVVFEKNQVLTHRPTFEPTGKPTLPATQVPTQNPTQKPTQAATQRTTTKAPTNKPTQQPVQDLVSETTVEEETPSDECLTKKFMEDVSLGLASGFVCDCVKDDFFAVWILKCFDTNSSKQCVPNRGFCSNTSDCCGDRRCSNRTCRDVTQVRAGSRRPLLVNDSNSGSSLRGGK